ncbi:hypothetical protein ASF53_18090 [Methylobacterium sp. Leaf123]|nr:hypothetical protein ASF53_18090 [Methylobacterium sp. Leaf123]
MKSAILCSIAESPLYDDSARASCDFLPSNCSFWGIWLEKHGADTADMRKPFFTEAAQSSDINKR